MDSEPPKGDDLQRLLVTMKQDVLARATPRRGPRRRRTGIAIGVVAALLLGAAGGSVALGLIPGQDDRAAPPAATATPEPTPTRTPDGAPVVDSPPPTPTPTPTSTRRPFALDDPGTWTISGTEVGPIALDGAYDAETDDLAATYVHSPCYALWDPREPSGPSGEAPSLFIVPDGSGGISGVDIAGLPRPAAPTTAEGLGLGSTLDELRAAYPDLHYTVFDGAAPEPDPADENPYGVWTTTIDGGHVSFHVTATTPVNGIWVSIQRATPPTEFCG
ncbi:hypothetical protein ACWGJ9_18700 [Curtobacterium citreum]